ncbi:uncharacterized protein BN461_01431 [Bacteroides sp. CAG:1076]|jgi:uncharacterized membrane protein|uniref:DUF975 family protein n=1 Tax=Phocaeicola sp. TaxID=2773926 RepID=UPI0003401643|nr:uncharacterized protein BN461_01431 [Bacteroides sp. CAG:1076]
MLKLNSELRAASRTTLSGNWMMAALATLVYLLIAGGVSSIPVAGSVLAIIVAYPLAYGFAILFLDLFREGKPIDIGKLFDGFKDFGRVWGTLILVAVYTILWTCLLIIPGIVKSYSYALTPFILKDEPELRYNAAIEKSMRMMNGYKMKLFLLDLSFIGWMILSILTLGIGLLFLQPYMNTARAAFYEDLKAELSDRCVSEEENNN